jgi:D-lactate dehydrogenase (cytochrome)
MNHPYALSASLKRPLPEALAARLRNHFGDRFSTAAAVREHHGRDESPFPVTPPDAVVFAQSVDDIVEAVKACAEHRFPIIAFGAGSSGSPTPMSISSTPGFAARAARVARLIFSN